MKKKILKWDINRSQRDLDRFCDYAIACQMEGGKISHAHVLVRVCKRINVCMNLHVRLSLLNLVRIAL